MKCEHCNKTFKNAGGLASHKRFCVENPEVESENCKECGDSIKPHKKFCSNSCRATYKNKGRNRTEKTKTKISNSLSDRKLSDKHKENIAKSNRKRAYKTYSRKSKICPNCDKIFETTTSRDRIYCSWKCYSDSDKSAIDYSNCGGRRRGSGISKGCWYESPIAGEVWLDSSYELAYAKWLDENDVKWERNTESFCYIYNGKEKEYIPDFRVEDSYVETKGFKTDLDESKWSQFPHELEVLYKEDLLELGCDIQGAVDELA